jgi:hypothetical protein
MPYAAGPPARRRPGLKFSHGGRRGGVAGDRRRARPAGCKRQRTCLSPAGPGRAYYYLRIDFCSPHLNSVKIIVTSVKALRVRLQPQGFKYVRVIMIGPGRAGLRLQLRST